MSCVLANIFVPNVKLGVPYRRPLSRPSFNVIAIRKGEKNHKVFTKYRKSDPICMAGGKGNLRGENEDFSWNPLKSMGGMGLQKSVQDWLREQMREREFGGNRGGGPPEGGGPLGGGGGGDGPEDEGLAGTMDEALQVVLATISLIFVYIYLISGAELTLLARDYINYLFGGSASIRLRGVMYKWGKFYESLPRHEEVREDWLERAIVATPTWWHKPTKLAKLRRSRDQ